MDLDLAERPRVRPQPATDRGLFEELEGRLGRLHARQRLGIEKDCEGRIFGQGLNFFHPENWFLSATLIRTALVATGLYWRARKNAENIKIRNNDILSADLPAAFEGFTILHLSDFHADLSDGAMRRLIELLPTISYDVCVLTGDYRAKTFGPYQAAIDGLARVRQHLDGPVYGVLGNHDTIRMVPQLEEIGIRMLLNESEVIERDGEHIHLVGIDDAHYYRMDNIEKAASHVPTAEFSILLSHTPEIYRQAAHAGFNLLLSGHTHGGQICLPGGIPVILDSVLPRRMGSGAWTYHEMVGYTSVGVGSCILPVRLNCPPEVTLHRLLCDRRPPQ
jgi:predicted MPP superfamily phosphohydrolase